MSVLMVAVIFGLGFAYLAVQNVAPVNVSFGNFIWAGIPLYAVALGSFLIGLFVSWILSMVDWLASAMRIQGKNHQLKETTHELEELREKLRVAEVENAKLRGIRDQKVINHPTGTEVREVRTEESRPRSVLDRIRHSISPYS